MTDLYLSFNSFHESFINQFYSFFNYLGKFYYNFTPYLIIIFPSLIILKIIISRFKRL